MSTDAWLPLLYAARGERQWLPALEQAGSAAALVESSARALKELGLSADAVARLKAPSKEAVEGWAAWLDEPNRRLITFGSARYPQLLARTDRPPLALWVEGPDPTLLEAPQLAMVGSRNATTGGRETAERFAEHLSKRGLTITSGLAEGIDAASHAGGLRGTGSTVAVFGCGIDVVFPRQHRALARQIAESGLLVSEYPPGVPPKAHQFPERNRIIAGLAVGTLVVEAGRRSGSLITARLANEAGREVFAIPGSIHNPLSRGCHALIRQGAKLVEEGADVLVELKPLLQLPEDAPDTAGEPPEAAAMADPAYENLLKLLDFQPTSIADIAARGGLTTAELSSMLLVLELEGYVEALPGGRYCRLPARSR